MAVTSWFESPSFFYILCHSRDLDESDDHHLPKLFSDKVEYIPLKNITPFWAVKISFIQNPDHKLELCVFNDYRSKNRLGTNIRNLLTFQWIGTYYKVSRFCKVLLWWLKKFWKKKAQLRT